MLISRTERPKPRQFINHLFGASLKLIGCALFSSAVTAIKMMLEGILINFCYN